MKSFKQKEQIEMQKQTNTDWGVLRLVSKQGVEATSGHGSRPFSFALCEAAGRARKLKRVQFDTPGQTSVPAKK